MPIHNKKLVFRPRPDLVGIVLAGGMSSRLGHDKGQIILQGKDLVVRTAEILQNYCQDVWLVGRDAGLHDLDIPWMLDDVPGKGPLGGILTALQRAKGRPCLVLSCDLPLINNCTLEKLITQWQNKKNNVVMTTFEQEETGFIEALVAIYEPQAIKLLQEGLRNKRYKLSAVIDKDIRHHIPYTQDQSLPFFNINYPSDLEMLRHFETHTPHLLQTAFSI